MKRWFLAHWFALGVLALVISAAAAADWPQWRGPGRDGRIPEFAAPAVWPKELARQWKVDVGEGHASPVVEGDRAFVFSREKDDEVVRAVSLADGKELWKASYPAPFQPSPWALGHGKGPKATPVVAGGKLYTVGIDSIVTCWDAASGKRLWQREFSGRFKKISPYFYGIAASPLVHGDALLAFVGRYNEGAMIAFDLASGKTRWEWTGDGPAYASAVIATLGGVEHVITQSQNACVGLAPSDGSLLWSVPFKTEYDQNIVTPVVAGDLVVFAGLGKPTVGCRLKQSGGKWTVAPVWENADMPMYMSSPVVAAGRLIGLTNRKSGQFFCLDLANGKTLWTSDGRVGENAAILAAGDTVLALTTGRQLVVFKASAEKFQPLATYRVADEPTWAHPAVVGKSVLIKDKSTLARWSW
ncbi:MAG: PQQ-like beta-propeller repeat protein [Thermoguttaceae bacterium]|jgi:outer membrane protein assembly factor BamB|nr:PQQ-like beta-propeller repeat protein [Thermoguttaceae bacterium]